MSSMTIEDRWEIDGLPTITPPDEAPKEEEVTE